MYIGEDDIVKCCKILTTVVAVLKRSTHFIGRTRVVASRTAAESRARLASILTSLSWMYLEHSTSHSQFWTKMFADTRNRLCKTDHIFLHRLCFRCRALDVNVEAAGLHWRFPTPHYPTRCMEQIVKASKFCHLCSLMLEAIERGLPDDATLPSSK